MSLSSILSVNKITHYSPSFNSFFRKAWQKSFNLAQTLIQFITLDHQVQKPTAVKTKESQVFIHQQKSHHQEYPIVQEDSFRKKQPILKINTSKAQDLASLFDSNNSFIMTQKTHPQQKIYLPKRKIQQKIKILAVPDKKGRINVKELIGKLKEQNQHKIQKQNLKISRSQFQFSNPFPPNHEVEYKNQKYFLNPKDNEKDKQKMQQKGSRLFQNNKCLQKSPIKGSFESQQQKMINENSPSPIVFRGDLSTILQSSTQQILVDNKIQNLVTAVNNNHNKCIEQNSFQKGKNIEKDEKKRLNPFLESLKQNPKNSLKDKSVIDKMKIQLFETPFGFNQILNQQTQKANNSSCVNTNSDTKVFSNNGVQKANHKDNNNSKFIFQAHNFLNQTTNQPNKSFFNGISHNSQTNYIPNLKPYQNSSSSFLSTNTQHKISRLSSFGSPNQKQQVSYFTQILAAKETPSFITTLKNNKNSNFNKGILNDEKSKQIFESFLKTPQQLSSNNNLFQNSLFFDSKDDTKTEREFDKKTERRSRLQGKKKQRKDQRIRG